MPPPGKLPEVLGNISRLVREWLARWADIDGRKKKRIIAGAVAGTLILATGYSQVAPNAWAVMINGQRVALVSSRFEVNQALQDIIKENGVEGLREVSIADRLDYKRVRATPREITKGEVLKQILQAKVSLVARATAITIDGKQQLMVRDESTADAILAELKQSYLPPEGNAQVQEIKLVEQVAYVDQQARVEDILSPEAALARLKGMETTSEYTVKKGDSLWSIAREHQLMVDDILAVNPDIKGEHLDIGQKLIVTYEKPLLQVMVVYNQEVTEPLPYEVKVEYNSSLYRGQERVKKPGAEGEQRVAYQIVTQNGVQVEKKVLEKQVLKEPETKIVERGTMVAVASRGGGSGQLAWPVNGVITSRYGYRGSEFHAGLDIGAPTGTPVGAAEAGTVTFVGYSGNYGRIVEIDHGGGLVTHYAHLSGYNVKTGQQVERGQIIGYVGSSGRATGPHLHFEVWVGGSTRNPTSYLN